MNILAVSKRDRVRPLVPHAKGVHDSITVVYTPREMTFQLRSRRPDVILVDRHMPHLTGPALLGRLLAEESGVPILIVNDIGQVRSDTLAQVAGLSPPIAEDRIGRALVALHTPTSGRANARHIANFLGLSLTELARILNRSPQSVHKTPDAPALQEKLSVLVRIAISLSTLFGSAENGRVWLNTPNSDLDKARPIELVKTRKAEVVAELLEDALLGHPG